MPKFNRLIEDKTKGEASDLFNFKLVGYFVVLFLLFSNSIGAQSSEYGHGANNTGDPVGGGNGFREVFTEQMGDYSVRTADQLADVLKNKAKFGDIVFVAEDIDFTEYVGMDIPSGVTLAGDRGHDGSEGALIYVTKTLNDDLAQKTGSIFWPRSDCRIMGLRIKGAWDPYKGIKPYGKCFEIRDSKNVEVANNYIGFCGRDGVKLGNGGNDAYIHHNFIDRVADYPVSVLAAGNHALIEANIITWVWHAIAGTGHPNNSYEARYNIFRRLPSPPGNYHMWATEMHVFRNSEAFQKANVSVGGKFVHVHHNTYIVDDPNDMHIREIRDGTFNGIPTRLGVYHHNVFFSEDPYKAVDLERFLTDSIYNHSNVWVYENLYGSNKILREIGPQTTPQIVFQSPALAIDEIPEIIGNKIPVVVAIHPMPPLTIRKVQVLLDGVEIYSGRTIPSDLTIDLCNLQVMDIHLLEVVATDSRGVSGKHRTAFKAKCNLNAPTPSPPFPLEPPAFGVSDNKPGSGLR